MVDLNDRVADLAIMATLHRYRVFETAHGIAAIAWSGDAVTAFRLPGETARDAEWSLLRRLPDAVAGDPPPAIAAVIADAIRYFAGEPVDFDAVAIDLGEQEPFFAQVYHRVRAIGRGETMTYGAVARDLGAGPEAARAVGQAMARNPIPLIVPCHRVLAAGSRVHGFSAPGGALAKVRMLEIEGVATEPPPAAQTAFEF
ncbi:methylated-DNA--[protein]-cysteine S-methyltransferase [Sphingomonas asaccharolytica]|uniref:methylated-DNA--[protein]-cysteine S-methyltransferase n=1 Tax=Sphingomonas asaccharolytica TaxID=40681 RepID=UPI001FE23499|nr:methylated-DNA--[protein]-cysteine S-methyltransferase [Sphingomonas asaccharolytica]